MTPKDLRYSETHEWVRVTGKTARIGISDFAQKQLGDIVYVELPAVGTKVEAGKTIGVVESVKTVSDVMSPVSGKVVGHNERLGGDPALVNQDCYGEGWIFEVELVGPDEVKELLDAAAYDKHCETAAHH